MAPRDETLLVHAGQIRDMLVYSHWVNRRVEQISFLDTETVRRHISIDFKLPPEYASPDGLTLNQWYVPLGLQGKDRPLVEFDLVDEGGRALPLAARERVENIAAGALVHTATEILDQHDSKLTHEMTSALREVVACELELAEKAIAKALTPRNGVDPRRFLLRDHFMKRLVEEFASTYLILAPISTPEERRVIKFSYREWIAPSRISSPMALGWRAIPFSFPLGGVGRAKSYHAEITAPPNLEVLQAKLTATGPAGEQRIATSPRAGERVHVFLTGIPSDWNGELRADLRASRPGMPSTAAALGVGVSLLLTAGALFHWSATGSETAGALLAAVPALVAAYLSRPEHELSSRLLRGVRWLTAAIGILVFLAAASTVVVEHLTVFWISIAGLSWLLTLALVISVILPRPDPSLALAGTPTDKISN